ncbi:hypothetical protein HN958_03730 [Candidatus Falkowbacteria bacterium]|jgi:hypothetical protein|nr:hypothetical protein [Candidatus Falkowbacteria bacterium]MBT7007588.1 hypothetical protein [Candidatus Falkowbacteria bacterium]
MLVKKIVTTSLIIICLMFLVGLFSVPVLAEEGTYNLDYKLDSNELVKAKKGAGLEDVIDDKTLVIQIATMMRLFSSLLAVAFAIVVVYAGFLWVRGGSDPENVNKAKRWLRNGVIGIFVVLSAYAISSAVINSYEQGLDQAAADQSNSGGISDRERADNTREQRNDEYIRKGFWDRMFDW